MTFYDEWCVTFMKLFLNDFGGTPEDAAAVFGNAGYESGGFQSLQEKKPLIPGSKGGFGIMQWTGPRRRDFENYCSRNSLNPTDMMTNYKFLFVELKGPEGSVLPKLFAAKTLEAKAEVFMKTFLRPAPATAHLDTRISYSKRALKDWQDSQVTHEPVEEQKVPDVQSVPKSSEASIQPSVADSKDIWTMIFDIIRKLLGK